MTLLFGKFINKVKISGDINVQTFISGNNYCFWDIKVDEEMVSMTL